MRLLLEHVMDKELPSIARKLEGFCWRVLPPEIILYLPCSELEEPEVSVKPISMPSQFGPTCSKLLPGVRGIVGRVRHHE